jgi:hypothetical protein
MKILVITEDVGKNAPGIVFERLLHGLSINNELTILTASYEPDNVLHNIQNIIISPKLDIHPRIYKFLIGIFGVNPYDIYWAFKSIRILNRKFDMRFEIIMSFLSYSHFGGLIAGYHYSKKHNISHAVYSVDAIPPPPGWLKFDYYYSGLQKMIGKYLGSVSFLFSLNNQMLSYQLKTFVPKKKLISGVIYTPGFNSVKVFPDSTVASTYNFVYTGGIYGLRKVDYILSGFQKLLKFYPNSILQFIGSQLPPAVLSSLESDTLKKIEILPFTKDLDPYYRAATALIDIDADVENDVFLSSKITNYLMINRVIISETSMNSPSRILFKGINSIIQCEHNDDKLCLALKQSIELKDSISFDDRKTVIQLFKIENIIKELDNTLRVNLLQQV